MRCPHCNKDTIAFWRIWIRGGLGRYKCPECGGLSQIQRSTKLAVVSACLGAIAALLGLMYVSWLVFVGALVFALAVDAYLDFRYESLQPVVGEPVSFLRRIGQSTRLWIVTALILVGIGGFYVGWRSAFRMIPMTDLFTAAQHETYLSVVRTEGNDAAYEKALRSNLSFLDTLNARSDHDSSDQWSYTFERALTLARLSRLAQKRGAIDEATQFAQGAEALCPTTGVPSCSVSKLLEVTDKMDNGTLFDSPSSPTPK
jgi:hypothetical protein